MTVNNASNTVSYPGNGVTTVWPYPFQMPDLPSVNVAILDVATQSLTALAPGDYSITGVGTPDGGEVTYPLGVGAPITVAKRIVIWREVPFSQDLDINNQSPYFPNTLEQQLDRMVMMTQQLAEESSRSIKVVQGSTASPEDLIDQIGQTAADSAASAGASAASAAAALASENLAEKWANEAEDVPVTPGLFSAFHWAQKAFAALLAMTLPAVPVALNYIRRNAGNTAYENRTVAQVAADISAVRYDAAQGLAAPSMAFARTNIGAFGVIRIQSFPSSGTYTPHPNMLFCEVLGIGGGGSGGSKDVALGAGVSASGGGGGAGACSRSIFDRATIGASKAVTIGVGATGGAGTGTTGGTTSLGSLLTAPGGGGGQWYSGGSMGGAGAVAGTANINAGGMPGMNGVYGANGAGAHGGLGGSSAFGAASPTGVAAGGTNVAGNAGGGRGAGGTGGAGNATASVANGGSGAPGILFVFEYCSE